MVDERVYARELAALADRFGRVISDTTSVRYYEFLNERMDTDAFERAARAIYNHDRYWPAPARFLEVVGMDPASMAERAWEVTLSEARKGAGRPLDEYGDAHAAAIRAVGSVAKLGREDEDRLRFVKREFVNAYRAAAEEHAADAQLTEGSNA